MSAQPGRLILPSDIKPLGQVEQQSADVDLRPASSLKFAPCDLTAELVFFNHGILFSRGGFTDDNDPLGAWYATQTTPVDVFKQAFRTPLFDGLSALTIDNRVPWDRVLCGVSRHAWPSLLEHLAGTCIWHPKTQIAQVAYYGTVTIRDPSYTDQYGLLRPVPTIQCVLFCLSGSDAKYEFVRPANLAARPRLEKYAPSAELVELGRKLAASCIDPVTHRHNPAHINFLLNYRDALERKPEDL